MYKNGMWLRDSDNNIYEIVGFGNNIFVRDVTIWGKRKNDYTLGQERVLTKSKADMMEIIRS